MTTPRAPTATGFAVLVVVVAGVVAAVLTRAPALAVGVLPFLLAGVVDLVATAPVVPVVRLVPSASRLMVGDDLPARLELDAPGPPRRWHCRLVTTGRVDGGPGFVVTTGGEGSTDVVLRGDGWGTGAVTGVSLAWSGPLGLTAVAATCTVDVPVRVLPRPEELRTLLRASRTGGWSGSRTSRVSGRGTEFADVRPFAAGDRPADVHGPTTARTGVPWVATRHPDRGMDLVLALDLFDPTSLREVVRVAVTLASAHLGGRDRVGVIGLGGVLTWVTPGGGERHRVALVDQVVASQFHPTWVTRSVSQLPPTTLPAGALVVAVTALGEQMVDLVRQLRSRGHAVVALDLEIPEPPTRSEVDEAAALLLRLRRRARRRDLRRLGVTVVGVPPGGAVEPALAAVDARRRVVGA